MVVPIVIGASGAVSNMYEINFSWESVTIKLKVIQKTALWEQLDCCGGFFPLGTQERTPL